MLLKLAFSLAILFFSTAVVAKSPDIKILKKLTAFLKPSILENKDEWLTWANENSALTEIDGFNWDEYVNKTWQYEWESVSDSKVFCEALDLFNRKPKKERWDQKEIPRSCIDVKEIERLLSEVGVRDAIEGKGSYEWGGVLGGTLFRMGNRIDCMMKYVIKERKVKIKHDISGIASNRTLVDEENADHQSVFLKRLADEYGAYFLYGIKGKDVVSEIQGMMYIMAAKMSSVSVIGPNLMYDYFDANFNSGILKRSEQDDIKFRRQFADIPNNILFGQGTRVLWTTGARFKKTGFNFLMSYGEGKGRATTVDNAKKLLEAIPDLIRNKESIMLFLSQPHAFYQQAIFEKYYKRQAMSGAVAMVAEALATMVSKAVPESSTQKIIPGNADIPIIDVVALPIDEEHYTLADQLHALQQWAQFTLAN